ncbi:MAG TPA: hypothetical protein VH372_02600, partial [Actinospica sp.]|nr:hypothetical protein [Actinospica sp.]
MSAPLKVDPKTDELISHGAHLLGMTKKDFVDEAVRRFLDERRGELQAGSIGKVRRRSVHRPRIGFSAGIVRDSHSLRISRG